MLLVDTNVVAYLLIDGDHTEAAQQLRRRDSDWRSEAFLLVEFNNVLASSVANKRMTFGLAEDLLGKAVALFDGKLRNMPPASVLSAAVRHRASAYDARFLALAEAIGLPVVTEDKKLRTAAPGLTQSLAEALALY
jgi:predicted nucleic acid-binding protein